MQTFPVHFEGFYGSVHDQEVDSMLEQHFCDEEGEPQEIPDNVDYRKIFLEYSQLYLKAFNQFLNEEFTLDVKLTFKELDSPRFYNYETDVIVAEVSIEDRLKIRTKFLADEDFVEFVEKASKSRSGFSSFYEGIEAVSGDDEIFLAYVSRYIIVYGGGEVNNLLRDTYYSHEMLGGMDFQTENA